MLSATEPPTLRFTTSSDASGMLADPGTCKVFSPEACYWCMLTYLKTRLPNVPYKQLCELAKQICHSHVNCDSEAPGNPPGSPGNAEDACTTYEKKLTPDWCQTCCEQKLVDKLPKDKDVNCIAQCFIDHPYNSEGLADCIKGCLPNINAPGIKTYLECCYGLCVALPGTFAPPGCCDACYKLASKGCKKCMGKKAREEYEVRL